MAHFGAVNKSCSAPVFFSSSERLGKRQELQYKAKETEAVAVTTIKEAYLSAHLGVPSSHLGLISNFYSEAGSSSGLCSPAGIHRSSSTPSCILDSQFVLPIFARREKLSPPLVKALMPANP